MGRRGFTLLETALAATIGGMVILTAIGLFGMIERSEKGLERQFNETRQLGTLQQVLRRSINTVLMSTSLDASIESATGQEDVKMGNGEIVEDNEPAWDGTGERPRIILEIDNTEDLARCMALAAPPMGDPMGMPQRLEIVSPRSPIPSSLRLPTQSWMNAGVDVENELEVYGISGPVRGVFEFRPDGSRERLLRSAGMGVATGERIRNDTQTGWTLWWRPVFPDEIVRLQAGMPATEADFITNAAEGYPIIRGVKRARFIAFDNRFRRLTYAARTATDLPAYFEIEIETWAGAYVNWMFEVGWVNGEDPTALPEEPGNGADQDADEDENNNGNDNDGGGRSGNQRRLAPERLRPPDGEREQTPSPQPRRPGQSGGGNRPGGRT
ncbi:MAG: hypothetical protein DYG94_01575 [Leptolyngbya sp. PLA3]|nr:MAG: hypothetical protein EDM82_00310 [Cyanobacteria bacterium CYA]MCE7967421.1 hypothetical protein [Leptolyngbya sp. PL-A3]